MPTTSSQVLRARIGQEFDIATDENVRLGRVVSVYCRPGRLRIGRSDFCSVSTPSLTLLLSIFKFDRMEWAIEKCVELGVARIMPVIAQRTDAHLAAAAPKRLERWHRIARQASEQSRRTASPQILSPVDLRQAVTRYQEPVLSWRNRRTIGL